MKRGVILNKFIMFLLFALVVAYMGFYIFRALYSPVKTLEAIPVFAEENLSLSGYIVRDEMTLEAIDGIAEIIPYEGERISKNEVIAHIYENEQALENKIEAAELKLRIEQLEYSKYENIDAVDVLKLDSGIYEQIGLLCENDDTRMFGNLRDVSLSLKNLIFKREYTFNSTDGADMLLDELRLSLDNINTEQAMLVKKVTSPAAGLFSALVDGYESILTPAILDEITADFIDSLTSGRADTVSASGKLVLGHYWYYIANVPESGIKYLKEQNSVTMRFLKTVLKEQTLNVDYIGRAENGVCPVVFSSKNSMADIIQMRRASVDIIMDRYEGIKVPKEAVRVQDGKNGVFCLVGLLADFKEIDIIFEKDNYYIVAEDFENSSKLRVGDEIIVSARDLEDGKVVR